MIGLGSIAASVYPFVGVRWNTNARVATTSMTATRSEIKIVGVPIPIDRSHLAQHARIDREGEFLRNQITTKAE